VFFTPDFVQREAKSQSNRRKEHETFAAALITTGDPKAACSVGIK